MRHYRPVHSWPSRLRRTAVKSLYNEHAGFGYIGTDSIGSLIKRFAVGKAGVEDEINNQRKAFLDMLAWSEGTDNDVRKPEIMVVDVIVGGELFTGLPWSPSQTCHAKPKTQIKKPDRHQLLSRWWGCLPQAAWLERLLSEKSGRCIAAIKERGAYLWRRGDIRQAPTVAAISGLHCRALVMVSSSIRLTAWLQNSKKRRNGQRDWCVSRVTAIISALVICIIVCLSWAVNHYQHNAITYKAQRDKNARELKLANAAITDMQMRQRDVAALDAKYRRS